MSDQEIIEELERSGDYKILRRIDLSGLPVVDVPSDFSLQCAVVLDVETTGLDPYRNSIIELAMRAVWHDEDFHVVALGEPRAWLEDPGELLSPQIVSLTGLTDPDLRGQIIDAEVVAHEVSRAGLVIAHGAGFDRAFFERRFPALKDLPWACSCGEVPWQGRHFDGRGLKALLAQAGFFMPQAHRAGADVDALIALLAHTFADSGRTVLAELVDVSSRTTFRLAAVGANFDVKSELKERGYRWNARECFWWREVEETHLEAEKAWLAASVYAPRHYPSAAGPRVERITSRERHRS